MRITLRRSHSIDPDELRRRAEARVSHYAEHFPHLHLAQHHTWVASHEARGHYRGASGRLALTPTSIEVEVDLPVFARLFRARIEAFVHAEIDRVLTVETLD